MSSTKTETAPKPAASGRPTLALTTPVTATFPREAMSAASEIQSARSDKTPLSAVSVSSCFRDAVTPGGLPSAGLPSAGLHSAGLSPYPSNGPTSARLKAEDAKTPITPPMAYTDFLRTMSLASPSLGSPPPTGKNALNRTSTTASTGSASSNDTAETAASEEVDGEKDESMPSSAASEETDVSCKCDLKHKTPTGKLDSGRRSPRPAAINTEIPPSPFGSKHPLSAPAGPPSSTNFPSLAIPPSPAVSHVGGLETPLSAKTPFSAKSVHSPFDWEAALKGRAFTESSAKGVNSVTSPVSYTAGTKRELRDSRSTIRHIREVVTRTVTYTPRMAPAPKGKRRKVDHETAVES